MTKNQIIEDLYLSKDFNDCINKMEPVWLRDDLKAEVSLALLEKTDEVIKELHELGKLKFFAVRIILNLIQSNTSPFYKKLRIPYLELTETIENKTEESNLPDRHAKEAKEDLALAELTISGDNDVLTFYERELVKLYLKFGNYREIEDDTKIPWESCYKTIQIAFKKLRYYAESSTVCQPSSFFIQTNQYDKYTS